VGLDHTRKIVLVREFDSWKSAALAIPKSPFSLSLTAKRARQMPMGRFWSLPVQMSAVAGLAFGYSHGIVDAQAQTNYVLSGRFRMNFFKESKDKVRIQLIGAHERGPGVAATVKLGGFDLLGIRVLDRALERLVDLKVFRADRGWRKGLGIAMDYVYDLRDPAAAQAYEKAVRVSLGFGGLLATHPLIQRLEMQEKLLTDLRPAEKLFGLYKESGEIQTFSLMPTRGSEADPVGPQPILMKAQVRDRRVSRGEVEDTRDMAARNLGPFLSKKLKLETASIPSGGKGFRAHVLLTLHPEATGKIFDPTQVSHSQGEAAALRTLRAEFSDASEANLLSRTKALIEAFLLAREIPGVPGNFRQVEAVIRLAKQAALRKMGARFLVELLGEKPTTEQVHVDVSWSGKGVEKYEVSYGSSHNDDLYLVVSEALPAVSDQDRPFSQ
jgi:hypothetical protein